MPRWFVVELAGGCAAKQSKAKQSEASSTRTHGRSEKNPGGSLSFVFTALDRGFALAV